MEKSTEGGSYYKRCNSSIRLGSESLRFDAEKKGGTGGAADGRPPVLNKEMNRTAVFGSNPALKEGSNQDSECPAVGPGWQASHTDY